MIDLPFALNGIDFRSAVNKNSYKTFLEPVYAGEMETLGKVRIRPLKRYRGGLHVGLNDLEENESARMSAELMRDPVTVTYYSFQRRRTVTETMQLEPYARAQLLQDGGERWLEGVTLKFEQN